MPAPQKDPFGPFKNDAISLQNWSKEPIAIIGIGCRFPGTSGPEELWKNLIAGHEAVGPYSEKRFAELDRLYDETRRKPERLLTDRGGFLRGIEDFDSQFFEISPRESIYIDPQHRLLLEVAWEALEDAGQTQTQYEGSATGVYTGLWTNEYEARLYESAADPNLYSVTGCGRASASGRLSFAFGFQGPSVTVDTACSSSLVAVQMACEALWTGKIDMALAGGANLILGPEISELFTKAKMLSADGRCKFGDASADGFVRSEGAGMVVLKPLSKAIADNDPIYAVIRGAAVNNDGRSSGFMVPSVDGQRQMLRAAWKSADVDPKDILFVEMHGTGTSVGDPVEISAVGGALAEAGVTRDCALGSIKTNIGHLESAAGIAGLIKAALAMKHRLLPPSLHFQNPNPKIDWEKIPVRIATDAVPFPQGQKPVFAGVNSFGLSGTNAHVVLEEAPSAQKEKSQTEGPYLLPVSAKSAEAVRALLTAYREEIQTAGQAFPIQDVCYTASVRRTHHENRAAIVAENVDELAAHLTAAIEGEEVDGVISARAAVEEHKTVFVAPGQGSQWVGMARELFEKDSEFRRAFEQCDAAILAETGWSLRERVLGPGAEKYLTEIDVIQPALFAMSVALAAVWQGWGITPDAVVGHSMGEAAAAHIAGILSLPDAVAVICRRSRLMKTLRGSGAMASIELPLDQVQELLQTWKLPQALDKVSIAASNGPNATVISGDATAIETLLQQFAAQDIYCRLIKVDVASHSAQVDPILEQLAADLADIQPRAATIPVFSTVTGELIHENDGLGDGGLKMNAAYWVKNLRGSVLFAPAIQALAKEGHDTFIELSPHPILLPSIESSAREINSKALAVASLRREKPEKKTMLCGLAALYANGRKVQWERLYPNGAQCVRLPQYPFQRERCWPEPGDPARARGKHSAGTSTLLGRKFESSLQPNTLIWETEVSAAAYPYLGDHRVMRSIVFPAAGHLSMALSAAKTVSPEANFEVRNASFASAAYIPEQGGKTFQLALTPEQNGAFAFEIRTRAEEGESAWPLRSSGVVRRMDAPAASDVLALDELRAKYPVRRDSQDHYGRTEKSGLQYGPAFQLIQEAWVGDGACLCRLRNNSKEVSSSIVDPALLDACFQTMTHVRLESGVFQPGDTYLPVSIERIQISHPVPEEGDVYVHAALTGSDAVKATMRADLKIADAEGNVFADVCGIELKRVARETLENATAPLQILEWIDEKSLDKSREKAEASIAIFSKVASENWILFADNTGFAEIMRESLLPAGGRCTLVRAGSQFRKTADDEFEIDPDEPKDFDRLMEEVSIANGVPTAVIHLWSLDNNSSAEYDSEKLIAAQARGSQSIPGIVQAINSANWQDPPRLWLITAGAMTVDGDSSRPRIENAPMWGIGRAVAREHVELRPTLVDLSAEPDPKEARSLVFQICLRTKEDRIALRGDRTFIARLAHFSSASARPQARLLQAGEQYRIEIPRVGILDNLELHACDKTVPGPGEVAIDVIASGLNFMDVAKVMGIYPGLDPAAPVCLGTECAGRIAAVGSGVSNLRVGDEVIAVNHSMQGLTLMSSQVCVPAEVAVRKPSRLNWEQAATTPVAYLTAYYSLVGLAHIRRGDWVLIHSATGGVGLAAIEIAKWAGANIVATVGAKEKEEYLRRLGIEHIFDSRSTSFAAGVMEATGGCGVDIVLNSLTGELQSKGLDVLAPYGRFIELGKRDIYDDRRVGLKVFRKNLSFHAVDLAAAIEEIRPRLVEMLGQVMGHIASGDWKPLPVESFSSSDPSVPFRKMAQARHMGKIAIQMGRDVNVFPPKDQPLFAKDATYLITGGLGGVALTVAEWMAANGAGNLVLLSRRAPSQESAAAIARVEKSGARVVSVRADVTRATDLAEVLQTVRKTMPPLKGVLHTAAVIDDALVKDLSAERFLPVMAPKIAGAWNLHMATLEEDLDFFILFSSIAAVHPQPGMGSYAAANAFLDAFARYRRGLGKPATSINWGGWDKIGLARVAGTERSIEGYLQEGMRVFSGEEALEALRLALETDPVQVIAVPFESERFVEFYGQENIPPAFTNLISKSKGPASQAARDEILDQLIAMESSETRRETMEAYLQEVLGRVLKLATRKIDRERPLGSMGLDSLMGLEFVRRLSQSLQIAVPATVVFNYPTVRQLAAHLLRRMQLEIAEDSGPVEVSIQSGSSNGKREDRTAFASGLEQIESEEAALHALIGGEQRSS